MEKTFFLQYQWFPIGVAALAFLYYLPYLLFCIVNADIIALKDMIKKKKTDEIKYDSLIAKYFTPNRKTASFANARILLNVVVKILYVVANVVSMIVIDLSLNGEFIGYGADWAKWLGKKGLFIIKDKVLFILFQCFLLFMLMLPTDGDLQ